MTDRPVHPNQRLSQGRGRRDEDLRRQLLHLLGQYDPDTLPPHPGPPRLLSLAAVGDLLGVSRQRVWVLAQREGVRGMVAANGGKKLRGKRRRFEPEGKSSENK